MIRTIHSILVGLFLAALLFAQTSPSSTQSVADTSQSLKPGSAAPAPQPVKSVDDELILDDEQPVGKDSPKTIETPQKPAPAQSTVKEPAKQSSGNQPVTGKTPPAGQVNQKPTEPVATEPAKKNIDEELILEGGEEDILGSAKANQQKASGTTPAGATPKDSSAPAQPENPTTPETPATATNDTTAKSPDAPAAPAVAAKDTAKQKKPVIIENARSINFAANLKDYRSPKLAMLMSLIVPGAGQMYARSSYSYITAASFVAVEAAMITTGVILQSKSNRIKADARKFADAHYSQEKFAMFRDELEQFLGKERTPRARDSLLHEVIFYDSSDSRFKHEAASKSDAFYDQINSTTTPFIRGWDDISPKFSANNGYALDSLYRTMASDNYLLHPKSDTLQSLYGTSANQIIYNNKLLNSRKWAGYARTTFTTMLINHVISAVMAGIEAKSHNDHLLSQESAWDHISVEPKQVNTGRETVEGYAIGIKF